MKKIFALVLTFALTLCTLGALTSCGGAKFDENKNISVVAREDGSGTKSAFMEIIGLKGKADVSGVIIGANTAAVLNEVKGNPLAIGYDSLSVQGGLREGAYALGTSKVRTIFKIVLPSAAGGIVTAIILAIGRVVSESAVLLLTINMVVNKVPESLMSPGTSLALDIYYFASHGYPDEAAATAVVLLIFVIILNLLAGWIGNMIRKSTYGDAK